MAVTFFNWIKTTLANIAGADVADADEFVLIDQDGDGASPPGPASKAITRAEASKALTVQQELAESPISPDNTVAEYVFDVTDYVEVEFQLDGVGFAASDASHLRFSDDNGATYKDGASDYRQHTINPGTDTGQDRSTFSINDGNSATDHNGTVRISNLRAGRARMEGMFGIGNSAVVMSGFANFAGPITHVKLLSGVAKNYNAGTIRATGIRGTGA